MTSALEVVLPQCASVQALERASSTSGPPLLALQPAPSHMGEHALSGVHTQVLRHADPEPDGHHARGRSHLAGHPRLLLVRAPARHDASVSQHAAGCALQLPGELPTHCCLVRVLAPVHFMHAQGTLPRYAAASVAVPQGRSGCSQRGHEQPQHIHWRSLPAGCALTSVS